MKSQILIIIFFIMGIVIFSSGLFFNFWYQRPRSITSPLSEDAFLETFQYQETQEKTSISDNYPPNDYFPLSLTPKYSEPIEVNAQAYAVFDRGNRELLLAKNLTQELPIASVTKIMTALVTLENAPLSLELKVSTPAAEIGEAEMGLTAGETLTVEELLYGLMLPSANDAAETLAEGVGKGRLSFIMKMNDKAKELHLFDTFFFNPTGLDGNDLQTTSFSTALDLIALTNYALNNKKFAEIVSTRQHILPEVTGKHKYFNLLNILQLDGAYPGVKGVKPGVTDFAGETLVSYAENGGKQVIVVLLNAENTRDQVVNIYDYIFPKLGVKIAGRT